MAPYFQIVSNIGEIHRPGEPLSLQQLENTPQMRPVAKDIRDALSITNKYLRDIELQNRQAYENFVSLFNRDIVFRLKVTQQYYLLLNLFKDPREKARWIKFLSDIRAVERETRQKELQAAPAIIKVNDANKLTDSASNQSMFHWTHPDPNLSNIEKWQHYEKELQRITFNYHVQRAHLRQNHLKVDIQNHTGYIDRMIGVLRHNLPEEDRAINELNKIKSDIETKAQVIMNIPVLTKNGAIDVREAARIDKEMELLQKDAATRMDRVFNNLGNKNPIINALRVEREGIIGRHAEEIRVVDHAFKEQEAQLMPHLKQASALTKQEVLGNLGKIINAATIYKPDKNQLLSFKGSIKKLEEYQKLLEKTEDLATVQTIIHDCKVELAKLKELLPATSYEPIKSEVEAVNKMVVDSDWMQPLPENDVFEADHQPYRDKVSLTEEKPSVSRKSDDQNTASVQSTQDTTHVGLTIPTSRPNMSPSDEELHVMRARQDRFRELVRPPESQEERQRKIALQNFSSKSGEIANDEDADERLQMLAKTTQALIIKIEERKNYEEVPDEIKESFLANLEELGEIDETFNDLKEKYAHLFEPLTGPSITP